MALPRLFLPTFTLSAGETFFSTQFLSYQPPFSSLSWCRNGSRLVSASTDNNVSVWDVVTGECEQRLRFPSPVLRVQFNPRDSDELLVVPMRHAAVVVRLSANPPSHRLVPVDDEADLHVYASYDKRGKHIFTGNSKGKILIVDRESLEVTKQFRVTQTISNSVKGIEFSRRTESFLVNTADRVIRVYNTQDVMTTPDGEDPEPVQKLQDLVNKTMWKKCCFSGDGEYVCAGSARQHALYIWEKAVGNLVKILHGTKGEMLLDVVWHPVRPIVASISSGVISVWAQQQVENWSAFAPDFKELDENVDYEERESEFDVEDEDRSVKEGEDVEVDGLEVDVDVDKSAPIPAFCRYSILSQSFRFLLTISFSALMRRVRTPRLSFICQLPQILKSQRMDMYQSLTQAAVLREIRCETLFLKYNGDPGLYQLFTNQTKMPGECRS